MPSCTSPSSQPIAGSSVLAEAQLAGRRDLQPHLVLDVGDVDAVARAEFAGVEIDEVLRHDEQRQALGAGPGALGTGQHEMHDVLGQVVLGAGDESLDALEVPGAVGLRDRLGPAGPDVGAGVGLGQHHRHAPAAVDHELGQPLLVGGAVAVEDARGRDAGHVHVQGRVGAEHLLGHRPDQAARRGLAAELGQRVETPELGVDQRAPGLLERLGQRDRVRRRVEHRRVAVGVGERLARAGPRRARRAGASISRTVASSRSAYGSLAEQGRRRRRPRTG